MKRTVVFHKTTKSNKNVLSLYIGDTGTPVSILGNESYVLVDEGSKLFIKLFNGMLDMLADKELTAGNLDDVELSRLGDKELVSGNLSNVEEEILFGPEVDVNIWLPLEVVGVKVSIHGRQMKIKAKHLVLATQPELHTKKFNVSTATPMSVETPLVMPEHLEDCWVNNMDSLKTDSQFLKDWVSRKLEEPFTKKNLSEYFNVWSTGDSFGTEVKRPVTKEVLPENAMVVIGLGMFFIYNTHEEFMSSTLMEQKRILRINNRCNGDVKALLKISYDMLKDKCDTTNKIKFYYTKAFIRNFCNLYSDAIVTKLSRINFSPLNKK